MRKDRTSQDWDAIVIGAGMGGGAMAYSLTRQGYSVLLLEKGRGTFSEDHMEPEEELIDPEVRLASGHWPTKIRGVVDSNSNEFWPALGCGIGGSTLLYAAALGRLDPVDFEKPARGETCKPEWPFGYDELEPYYAEVEKLFRTCGTVDPLSLAGSYELLDPPAMSEADRVLFGKFTEAGLHPYRLHCGIEYRPGCDECGGVVCNKSCKSDAKSRFIEPALETGLLKVLPEAEVEILEADAERVQATRVRGRDGMRYSAKMYVLSAGAFFSPAILLKSRNEYWPDGIGNARDLVGRNLMFHAADFVLMWPGANCSREGPKRSIAFRDFYTHAGRKLGEVQTMGLTAGYGLILTYLHQKFDQSRIRSLVPLRSLLRIPAFIASKLFKDATVFSAIVEDFPYPDNRIHLDDCAESGIRFEYEIREELRERVKLLRTLLRKRVKSVRSVVVNQDVALNFGHPCGTCKAGNERSDSVLDATCKVHGLNNLYVVDSSFFPSSGGTNPSLTIAANALRVADIIGSRLANGRHSSPPE